MMLAVQLWKLESKLTTSCPAPLTKLVLTPIGMPCKLKSTGRWRSGPRCDGVGISSGLAVDEREKRGPCC